LAGADHGLPPARFLRDRMGVGDVLVAGQRVTRQNGVRARGIECAVGLIGDLKRAELDAGIELERLVGPEAHDRRMRLVDFADAIGTIEGAGDVYHTRYSGPARP